MDFDEAVPLPLQENRNEYGFCLIDKPPSDFSHSPRESTSAKRFKRRQADISLAFYPREVSLFPFPRRESGSAMAKLFTGGRINRFAVL